MILTGIMHDIVCRVILLPNGSEIDSEKYKYKLEWFSKLHSFVNDLQKKNDQLIILGDFNIAPTELDVGIGEANVKRWLRDGKTAFLPEEIEMWNKIRDLGFIDSWREQNPSEASIYSWFDYRSRMFDDNPKRGLRIDHILISKNLKSSMIKTGIDYSSRAMEKPSDHCPIWIEL